MSIEIRRIRAGDAPVLKRLRISALTDRPDAFGSTLERELAFDDDLWDERASEASGGSLRSVFLAWSGDEAVGIVGGMRESHDAAAVEIVSMWTSPSARRLGIGRRLVEAVVDWATDAGAERIELWVTRGNDSAQRLYETLDFVVTDEHQPLPSDPCKEEVRMTRPITDPRSRGS
jgi:GNAT superfamily N-acetyltransferase